MPSTAIFRPMQSLALPGGPLSQFSHGAGYAAAQRVAGASLMEAGFGGPAQKKRLAALFYSSTGKRCSCCAKGGKERYPGVVISGMMSPPFREMTPQEDWLQAVANQRNKAGLCVGWPWCPKQKTLDGRP